MAESTGYRPIGDYAYLSDCHSVALVSREGSVDWCCMPRVDSASVFGRLLDADRGGFCSIRTVDEAETSRRYVGDTLVLETTFRSSSGEARLLDCFTMREGGAQEPYRQLVRVPRLPRKVAENLIEEFGSLEGLLDASEEELDEVEGVGQARARAIHRRLERQRNLEASSEVP